MIYLVSVAQNTSLEIFFFFYGSWFFPNSRASLEEGTGMLKFLWSESPSDLPDKVGWLSASQRTLTQAGGLAYKSSGYTPRTQALCQAFNGQLLVLRQDLANMYSEGESCTALVKKKRKEKKKKHCFDREKLGLASKAFYCFIYHARAEAGPGAHVQWG